MERKMFNDYPDVVNVTQMREMLGGMCNQVATKLLKENKIKHMKIGRRYYIPKSNIIDFIEAESNKE